jgi:hypothetical protein
MGQFTTSKSIGLILSIRMVAGSAEVIEGKDFLVAGVDLNHRLLGYELSDLE